MGETLALAMFDVLHSWLVLLDCPPEIEGEGTPEAVAPLLDKTIEGFGELFRLLSFESIGTRTLQSEVKPDG